jgi:hypothetical protein
MPQVSKTKKSGFIAALCLNARSEFERLASLIGDGY